MIISYFLSYRVPLLLLYVKYSCIVYLYDHWEYTFKTLSQISILQSLVVDGQISIWLTSLISGRWTYTTPCRCASSLIKPFYSIILVVIKLCMCDLILLWFDVASSFWWWEIRRLGIWEAYGGCSWCLPFENKFSYLFCPLQ